MIIRKATSEDRDAIVAFNQAMAFETENKTLPEDKIVPGVSRVLSDENLGFYLVAEVDDKIVGSLMVTYEWSDWRNGPKPLLLKMFATSDLFHPKLKRPKM